MESRRSRIITREEMERIGNLPPGKAHWVRKRMNELKVGEALLVDRQDWDWVNKTPQVMVKQENGKGKKKFEFSVAADDSGWFIERTG